MDAALAAACAAAAAAATCSATAQFCSLAYATAASAALLA